MEFTFRGIPHELVQGIWRFADPYIKRALDHTFGEISSDDIRMFCEGRDMQLWMTTKGERVIGAGVTQIIEYPQMRVCRIIALSGNSFPEWKDVAHMTIEVWAEQQGCKAIEAFVRKGFVPVLAEIGYKHRYSVVHKPIRSG